MKTRILPTSLALIATALFTFYGCKSYNNYDASVSGDIKDNQQWYENNPQTLLHTFVTIPVPNDYLCKPYNNLSAPERPCTLTDVLNDINALDSYEPELHVMYANDEYSASSVNASFEQKGKTTRKAKQKSFRIKLDANETLFNGEETFQLNKHPFDDTRVKNKLYFEIFQDVPHITSLRTRFVNLSIDAKPYGLYTHIEHYDSLYLKNHGFGLEDNLYKAQNFSFELDKDLAVGENGRPLNPEAFDKIIEVENGKEQGKFIEMLNAINKKTTDNEFMDIFYKYFNEENYLTWLAINIITSNKDTTTQNFFLLNPKFSNKFYFLPWDYDGAGLKNNEYAKWELGLANWWEVPLHRKYMSIKENRDKIDAKVYELREKYFSDAVIHKKMDSFRTIVEPMIQSFPDAEHLSHERWLLEFNRLRNTHIATNLANYESQKGTPMPYWQSAKYIDGKLTLTWGESIDFEGDPIAYKLQVATNPDFINPIISLDALTKESPDILFTDYGELQYTQEITLHPGKYYMKVIAYEVNNPQSYQIGFEKEVRFNDKDYFGVLEFIVE
jgi:spore coat protein H